MIRISLAKNDTKSECEFTIMLPRSYFSTTHREKVGEQFETEKQNSTKTETTPLQWCYSACEIIHPQAKIVK
jgi:hypothetical protein